VLDIFVYFLGGLLTEPVVRSPGLACVWNSICLYAAEALGMCVLVTVAKVIIVFEKQEKW